MRPAFILPLFIIVINCELSPIAFGATMLTDHAAVGARTLGGGVGDGESVRISGNGGITTGELNDVNDGGGSNVQGSAVASVTSLLASNLLHVSSSAFGSSARDFTEYGKSQAYAAWTDVAFVAGAKPSDVLRLTFSIDGKLNVSSFGGGVSFAEIAITRGGVVSDLNNAGSDSNFRTDDKYSLGGLGAALEQRTGPDEMGNLVTETSFFAGPDWDYTNGSASSFYGIFHFDVPYDDTLGGYGWSVSLHTFASGHGGSGNADFGDTLSLDSVTFADGAPVNVTFDSGLTFAPTAAAPEPSTFGLFSLGAIGLALRRRACRKAW